MSDPRSELERIVRLLVDSPGEVRIDEVPGRGRTVLELRAAACDVGKVIGRQGRTARALRTLLAARSEVESGEFELEILDE